MLVQGLPARQPDLKEEKKGPRVGAPQGAMQGFLKGAGLTSIEEATIQKDPKKGDFYLALIEKPGRPALELLAEILPVVIRTFPWPKSMRWGDGRLTWVRPLHSIVGLFGLGPEGGDDRMQRPHPGEPAIAPAHGFRPGKISHHVRHDLADHLDRRTPRLLADRHVEVALLWVLLDPGFGDRGKAGGAQKALDRALRRADARALLLLPRIGLPGRHPLHGER